MILESDTTYLRARQEFSPLKQIRTLWIFKLFLVPFLSEKRESIP